MTLTLDAATEKRIQREIDRGIYRSRRHQPCSDLLTAEENSLHNDKAVA